MEGYGLTVNQSKKDEKIMLSFRLITTLGEQEAEIYV